MTLKSFFTFIALFLSITSLSGCLRTRAQLREDGDDSPKAVSAPVQDVQPAANQYAVDEIKNEITRLTGRLEDLERNSRQRDGSAISKEDLKKLETRITELEQAQAASIQELKKMQETAVTNADPSSHLTKAREDMTSKNYESAVEALDAYIKSPKAKKLEEAHFLRGEAFYNLKEFKKAILDFSKFPEKFTKSSYMPGALYRIGQSFDHLGMKDDAKGFYQELLDKFPKSAEAKKVKAKER